MRWTWLGAIFLLACGTSHTGRDGGTACSETPPTGCAIRGASPGECIPAPATCVDGVWECSRPEDMGWSCESMVGCDPTLAPRCYPDLGAGCCGIEVPAECVFISSYEWRCGPGTLEESTCAAFEPECGGCETLAEVACEEAVGCAPIYDDACCSTCEPGGPCADCTRPVFHHCASIGAACADDPPVGCGTPAPWTCASDLPDCSLANPVDDARCDLPGCITAVDSLCMEPCVRFCVPLHEGLCTALCDIPEPPCPAGFGAEAEEGCYTGRCIGLEICFPSDI